MAVRGRSDGEGGAEESTQKRRKAKAEDVEDAKSFKLSDYTEKRIQVSYKQIKLDENLERGQVCTLSYAPDCFLCSVILIIVVMPPLTVRTVHACVFQYSTGYADYSLH